MAIEETEIEAEEIFQLTRSIQQEEDLHIRIFEESGSEDALIIQGFPDLGFVGQLCCRYLMQTNEVKRVAGVHSKFFAPMIQMFEGEIIYPITLFKLLNLEAIIDDKHKAIYILASDTSIPEIFIFKLMTRLFSYYQKMNINHIITLDSLQESKHQVYPKIYELNSPNNKSVFDLQSPSNTFLIGTSAACLILSDSIYPSISNTILLAESSPYNPKPEVVLKMLKTLKKRIPAMEIQPKFILELVERLVKNTGTPFTQFVPRNQSTDTDKEKGKEFQSYG
ncbi:MAG: PAC2 family protein [Candidatus Hodarchaeota archaeon]